MQEIITKYIEHGLPIFPCNSEKEPSYGVMWKEYKAKKEKDYDKYEYIGLRTGQGNDNFYCIDFDLKNTSNPNLFKNYLIELKTQAGILSEKLDIRKNLHELLIIQGTKNKGYHLIFKTDDTDANKKLAMSEANKVIIETRGTGGYIIIHPSEGYSLISKTSKKGNGLDIWDAPYITNDEKALIENLAYSHNKKLLSEYKVTIKGGEAYTKSITPNGKPPWEEFDDSVDGVGLMENYGWSIFRESGDRVYMTRPGKNFGVSGNWHIGLRVFYNFSSNVSELPESDRAYRPFTIYTYYEHNGDFSEAAKALYSQGYGDRIKNEEEIEFDNVNEYVYSFDEVQKELEMFYKGEIEKGKSTGSNLIDKHFLFKKNEFTQFLGDMNIGKTFVMQFFIALAIRFVGWKVIIAIQENKHWDFLDGILSFLNASNGNKSYSNGDISYSKQMKFLKSRVKFIKSDGKSIIDVINIAKALNEKEKHDLILLDPLNGFKVDTELKLGYGHEYHHNIAMELLNFSKNIMSVYLNTHTTVGNQRGRKGSKQETGGERRVPQAQDAEHGGSYSNKADTVVSLDRAIDADDPYDKRTTLMWVKKIRNGKLGGETNPDDKPIHLEFDPEFFGFNIMLNGQTERNPLLDGYAFKESMESTGYNTDMEPNENF